MGFNIAAAVVDRCYFGNIEELEKEWNSQLKFIGEISFEEAVENWKEDFDQQVKFGVPKIRLLRIGIGGFGGFGDSVCFMAWLFQFTKSRTSGASIELPPAKLRGYALPNNQSPNCQRPKTKDQRPPNTPIPKGREPIRQYPTSTI